MNVDGAAPVRTKIKEIVPEYSFDDGDSKLGGATPPEGKFRTVAGHD
jgi:hypothetical protein